MNRKAFSGYSMVFGAIVLIIGIGVLYLLFGLGNKPVNEVNRCAIAHCFQPTDGCPDYLEEAYYPSKLKCDDKNLVCCTPASDPLSLTAKSQEKASSAEANNLPTPGVITTSGKIHILMNDDPRELPISSPQTLQVGKSYSFTISADGLEYNNCMIKILDESKTSVVDASWILGVGSGACTKDGVKTIITPDSSLINKKYTLVVSLTNKSTNNLMTDSRVELSFVLPDESNAVVVK